MKNIKSFESFINKFNEVEITKGSFDSEPIESVSDEYIKLTLKDLDVEHDHVTLYVELDRNMTKIPTSRGIFNYYFSTMEDIKGNIEPVELYDYFREIWEDDMDAVVELLYELLNKANIS